MGSPERVGDSCARPATLPPAAPPAVQPIVPTASQPAAASLDVALDAEEGATLAISAPELRRVLALVLAEEGVGRPCSVSVSVVGERTMQDLNREWRGVDRPTDVISLECERPDDADLAPGEPCELGDIAMAPEVLACQAALFGVSAADETRLMAIHSMLHLLGFDHLEEDEARVMEAREDELLALACDRAVGHVELTRHLDERGEAAATGELRPGGSPSFSAAEESPRRATRTGEEGA